MRKVFYPALTLLLFVNISSAGDIQEQFSPQPLRISVRLCESPAARDQGNQPKIIYDQDISGYDSIPFTVQSLVTRNIPDSIEKIEEGIRIVGKAKMNSEHRLTINLKVSLAERVPDSEPRDVVLVRTESLQIHTPLKLGESRKSLWSNRDGRQQWLEVKVARQ
jgi:hypothetical protein